jgi:hypothetical protein
LGRRGAGSGAHFEAGWVVFSSTAIPLTELPHIELSNTKDQVRTIAAVAPHHPGDAGQNLYRNDYSEFGQLDSHHAAHRDRAVVGVFKGHWPRMRCGKKRYLFTITMA